MSRDFSITNLRRDVENSAARFGLPDTFQARFAKQKLDARELGVSLQTLGPGQRSPFAHRHREQPEELYVVVAGGGSIMLDGVDHALSEWDVVHVAGPVMRSFRAGERGLELLAFGYLQPSDSELVELEAGG